MTERDEPLIGLTTELVVNPETVNRFSGLTEPGQKQVANGTRNVKSHEGMRNYAENMLTEG